jgi:hypothetical protein
MAINMDLISNELDNLNNDGGNSDLKETKFTPKAGKTKIRFVGNKFSSDWPFKRFKTHFNLKPMVNCLENHGEDCPVCKYCIQLFREAKKENDENKRELARKIMASERFYAPILVRGEDKVRIFNFSKTVYEKILGFLKELGDITDANSAPDFIVEKTPPGANGLIYGKVDVVYDIPTLKTPLPIAATKAEIDAILDTCPDLDALYNKPTTKDDAIKALKDFITNDDKPQEQTEEEKVGSLLEEAAKDVMSSAAAAKSEAEPVAEAEKTTTDNSKDVDDTNIDDAINNLFD